MYEMTHLFNFGATRALAHLPDGDVRATPQEQYFDVWVTLRARALDHRGLIRDSSDLAECARYLALMLDGSSLNVAMPFVNPTDPHLARHLFDVFSSLVPEVWGVRIASRFDGSVSDYHLDTPYPPVRDVSSKE